MKKVMVVSTVGLIYDGITSVIVSYLEAMDRRDLDIYVVSTIKAEAAITKKIEKLGCHVISFPSRRTNIAQYFFSLLSFIRKNRIDVIHAHGNSATLSIEMLAGWLGGCKKRIAHSHNTKCDQVKADKILRPFFYRLYTEALACGQDAGKWLFGDRKFEILQNGRDVDKYAYQETVRKNMRENYGFQEQMVVGHVGGFYEQKNHRFLVQVFRSIRKLEPEAHFFLIGNGPLKAEIEELAGDMKNCVTFTGAVDNVPDYLQMLDGMLLPSLFEGLPLVAVEWQLNGLPCVLSDTITKACAFTENMEFMSLQDDTEKWAEKIVQMIRNNRRYENSKTAGQKAGEAGFDIRNSAGVLRELYMK